MGMVYLRRATKETAQPFKVRHVSKDGCAILCAKDLGECFPPKKNGSPVTNRMCVICFFFVKHQLSQKFHLGKNFLYYPGRGETNPKTYI